MLHDSLNGGKKNTRKNIIFLIIVKNIDKKKLGNNLLLNGNFTNNLINVKLAHIKLP
jgi:hypothetical protein